MEVVSRINLLDVSIMLTKPPQASLPDAIASIALQCDKLGINHMGGLLRDPLTQQERHDLRWYLEEYWKWPYLEFAERGKQVEALLYDVGRRLYNAVFGSIEAQALVQEWQKQPGVQHQISILSDIPECLNLPWELLHDEQGFLALRPVHPIAVVRRLPQNEEPALSSFFEPPLRVLLVTARPEGAGFIDPRCIAHELMDETQGQIEAGAIEIEFLRPPTLKSLLIRLANVERPIHVLHFDGHGVFDEETRKQGILLFETETGRPDPVIASDLARVLRDSEIRLAVLTACQSAMGAADNTFSSVATQLIRSGVDAVVAMSTSILVASATRYAEALYRAIAMGISIPFAQAQARQALHTDLQRHLHRRRRDEAGRPVELHDWWLPHFYQQRSFMLQPTKVIPGSIQKQQALPLNRLSEGVPTAPRYGFSGRARELLKLERSLLRGQLVVIHGFGGIGKTALAREAADWLTQTKMFNGACFVSFEHGGDAAMLLRTIGSFLGIYDGQYNPYDHPSSLARMVPVLKEKRMLLIADNLESILSHGETPLERGLRTQLWDVLLALGQMGVGVLLTSRDTNFDDRRLAPGGRVVHLQLGGLDPEDAYTFACHLMNDLGISPEHAPYVELRALLLQLDHHPFSIQLVLPTLRSLSLSKISIEFAELLPMFTDDMTMGRNSSLLASIEYAVQRLSKAQSACLPRLALFKGGANKDTLLKITEIAEVEWSNLQPALEQLALLLPERVHEAIAVPFLHFHPVLAPYLCSLPGIDDVALRERYVVHYSALIDYLSREDARNPRPVRLLIHRELPNLLQAVKFAIESNNPNVATEMAAHLARFLTYLGLNRERDELRDWITEVVHTTGELNTQTLTRAEYLHMSGLGEDEFERGNLHAATAYFIALLTRIEVLPEDMPRGRASYEHCQVLRWLSRCLDNSGQPLAAEVRLREALHFIDVLISQHPNTQSFVNERGVLLSDLANVLLDKGEYAQVEEVLKASTQRASLRDNAITLGQFGRLSQAQGEYIKATSYYTEALRIFQTLNEPVMEAITWHQLGRVAGEQKELDESERCFRESLALREQLGDVINAAKDCSSLGNIAYFSGRLKEAEGWHRRALELAPPSNSEYASYLNNLASVLLDQVRTEFASRDRLRDARNYAERALAIKETHEVSSNRWGTLGMLATIADLDDDAEQAREYHRREREAFVQFSGNRALIDKGHGAFISDLVAAAQGNKQLKEDFEEAFPVFEAQPMGRQLVAAIRRIWAGERDWHALVEDLDGPSALLILRVLETLAQLTKTKE